MENYVLSVKSGDVVTFRGMYYHVPDWMDDQPVVFTKPFLHYTEGDWESEIDSICIDLCVDGKYKYQKEWDVENDIRWSGKSSKSIKRAIAKAFKTGEKAYASVWNEAFECKVEFYEELMDPSSPYDKDENPMEMKFKIIEQKVV